MRPTPITDLDSILLLKEKRLEVLDQGLDSTDETGLISAIIYAASMFYAICPEDFKLRQQRWDEGYALFGDKNVMHWSAVNGFKAHHEGCSSDFLRQFREYHKHEEAEATNGQEPKKVSVSIAPVPVLAAPTPAVKPVVTPFRQVTAATMTESSRPFSG